MNEALPEPTTEMFNDIAAKYFDRWNYPNCIGAIDGKHVRIVCPANTTSAHFNYKDFFSVVLLAIVGPAYKFIAIDVGAYGREGDSGIFQRSAFGRKIAEGSFNIPPPTELPNTDIKLPHVIVGDEAFTLHENLMRSFPRKQALVDRNKATYNFRHSRARRTTENAFGIMASYFRIFHTSINAKTNTIDSITIATCILHNLMRSEKIAAPEENIFNETADIQCPANNLISMAGTNSRANLNAYTIREKFMDYFINDQGMLEWQDEYLYTH